MTQYLLEPSIAGALLIALIMLSRRLGRGRIPPGALVCLWDIAALRLLIPWSSSRVAGLGSAAVGLLHLQQGTNVPAAPADAPDPLFVIWAAGAAVAAGWIAAGYTREARRLALAVPLSADAAQRCHRLVPPTRGAKLFVGSSATTAVAAGILTKKVVLPAGYDEWSDETLRCVLVHEMVHLRRKDNLRRIVLLSAACLHWFNPLAWAAAAASAKDVEAACDQRSVQLLGTGGRSIYAHALVDLAEEQCRLRMNASTFSAGTGARERVEGVVHGVRRGAAGTAALIAVAAAAVSSFAAGEGTVKAAAMNIFETEDTAFIVDTNTGQVWDLDGKEIGRIEAHQAPSAEVDADAAAGSGRQTTVTYFVSGQ